MREPDVESGNNSWLKDAIDGSRRLALHVLECEGLASHAHIEARIARAHRPIFDADDVMQITCLEAFLHIREFVPARPGSFAAWLRRLAENNLRDTVRELQRDKRPPPGKRVVAG